MAVLGVRGTCVAGGGLFGMMVEGSRRSRARQRTLCCCARPPQATSSVHENDTIPASGVEEVDVVRRAIGVRPEEACAADMRMSGRAWE